MSQLKERSSLIEKAKLKGQQAADKASQAVSEKTSKVTEQTAEQAEKIKSEAFKQLDKQSTGVGKLAQNAVDDLEKLSAKLAIQGRPESAHNASAAASLLSRVSNYLLDATADDIVADLEKLGKEPSGTASKGLSKGISAISFLGDASVASYREYWNPTKPKPSQPEQAAKLDKDYDFALSSDELTKDIHFPADAASTQAVTAPTVRPTTAVKAPAKAKATAKPKAAVKSAAKPKAANTKAATTKAASKATAAKSTAVKSTAAKSQAVTAKEKKAPAKAATAKAKATPAKTASKPAPKK